MEEKEPTEVSNGVPTNCYSMVPSCHLLRGNEYPATDLKKVSESILTQILAATPTRSTARQYLIGKINWCFNFRPWGFHSRFGR